MPWMNAAIRAHSTNTHVSNAPTLNQRNISYIKLYNHNGYQPFGFTSLCYTYSSHGNMPFCSMSLTSLRKIKSSFGTVPYSSPSSYSYNYPIGSVLHLRPYSHLYGNRSAPDYPLSPVTRTPGISTIKLQSLHTISSNATLVQYSQLKILTQPCRITFYTQISLFTYSIPYVKLIKTQTIMNYHLHNTSIRLYIYHIDVIVINYILPHSLIPTPINKTTVHYKLFITVNLTDQAILRYTSVGYTTFIINSRINQVSSLISIINSINSHLVCIHKESSIASTVCKVININDNHQHIKFLKSFVRICVLSRNLYHATFTLVMSDYFLNTKPFDEDNLLASDKEEESPTPVSTPTPVSSASISTETSFSSIDTIPPPKRPKVIIMSDSEEETKVELYLVLLLPDTEEDSLFSRKHCEKLEPSVFKAIKAEINPQVKFEFCGADKGRFKFVCPNLEAKEWALSIVPKLTDIFEKPKIEAVDRGILPKLTRASITFNDKPPNMVDLFEGIENKNETLDTLHWRPYKTKKVQGNKTILFIGIDEASVTALKAIRYRPNFEHSRITITIQDNK